MSKIEGVTVTMTNAEKAIHVEYFQENVAVACYFTMLS